MSSKIQILIPQLKKHFKEDLASRLEDIVLSDSSLSSKTSQIDKLIPEKERTYKDQLLIKNVCSYLITVDIPRLFKDYFDSFHNMYAQFPSKIDVLMYFYNVFKYYSAYAVAEYYDRFVFESLEGK